MSAPDAGPRWVPGPPVDPAGPQSPYMLWALQRPDLPTQAGKAVVAFDADGAEARIGGASDCAGAEAAPLLLAPDTLRPEGAAAEADDPGPPLTGAPVLLGVVDDAPCFAHERLRDRSGRTRVDYLWLQGAPWAPGGDNPPFGRAMTRPAIDALMDAHRGAGGALDEDGLYRAAGLVDLARGEVQSAARRFCHGAAVADIAGGGHGLEGFPLALVGLPPRIIGDTSGAFAAPFVIAGVARILAHAARRGLQAGRPLPVVVNVSLGLTGGPKDGSGAVELALDRLARTPRPGLGAVTVVLPTGNHRQARTRARMAPGDGPLFWRLAPDDRTPSFVEVWGQRLAAAPASAGFTVGLGAPGWPRPLPAAEAGFGRTQDLRDADGRLLARLWTQWRPDPRGGGRVLLTLAAPPTRPAAPGAGFVTPGDWALAVIGGAGAPAAVDLFVQRDDTLPGFHRGGRQSRLHDPAHRLRDDRGFPATGDAGAGLTLRSGTINSFATGAASRVVQGVYAATGRETPFGGLCVAPGHEPPTSRPPTDAAPSAHSPLKPWLRVAGSRSGGRAAAAGTSLAAPAVARRLAGLPPG